LVVGQQTPTGTTYGVAKQMFTTLFTALYAVTLAAVTIGLVLRFAL